MYFLFGRAESDDPLLLRLRLRLEELLVLPLLLPLDPRFLEVLKPGGGIRPARLQAILEEECDGAFSFPLLRPEFCHRLLQAADKYQQSVEHRALEAMDYAARERPLVLATAGVQSARQSARRADAEQYKWSDRGRD